GARGGSGAWSPFTSGTTCVRAGAGIFFDWFDAQAYEQGVQLDGTHQQIETIISPGFPDPQAGGRAILLPAGRVQFARDLTQPTVKETMAGVEQVLPGDVRLNAMYIRRRGSHLLRSVNVNAPDASGVRPDPASGPVAEVQSIARSSLDMISVTLNYARPQQRIFAAASYTLSRAIHHTASPFGLPP